MTKLEKVDFIVTELNGFMDGVDAPFWSEEFGCTADEIVPQYGFGYTNDGTIMYLPDLTKVPIPIEKLYTELLQAHGHIDDMRALIFWIYRLSE